MVAKAATKSGEFFCFHCGKQVREQDTGCKSCGSPFDNVTEAFRCPRCSNLLPIGAAACPACGLGFKVRTINTKLTEDDKFLMKLIDWGKQGETPPPKPAITRTMKPGTAPPLPPPPPATVEREVTAETVKAQAPKIQIKAPPPSPGEASMEPMIPKQPLREAIEEEIPKLSVAPVAPAPAPATSLPTVAEEGSRGLSNQALKRLLEEREKEVRELREREEELARKEEHLNRKIRAYAVKKKELEVLEKQVEIGRKDDAMMGREIGTAMDDTDFPTALDVDDKQEWIKQQSKIKMGLIEIRNQMGPKKDYINYYPTQVSGDVMEKIEVLEEKLADVTKERDDLSVRLKNVESSMGDIVTLLKVLDQLLGRLPPETIDEFSKSKDFKLYEKVLDDLNI